MDGERVCGFPGPSQSGGGTSQPACARSFEEFLFQLPAVLEPPVCFLFLARELRDFETIVHIGLFSSRYILINRLLASKAVTIRAFAPRIVVTTTSQRPESVRPTAGNRSSPSEYSASNSSGSLARAC